MLVFVAVIENTTEWLEKLWFHYSIIISSQFLQFMFSEYENINNMEETKVMKGTPGNFTDRAKYTNNDSDSFSDVQSIKSASTTTFRDT